MMDRTTRIAVIGGGLGGLALAGLLQRAGHPVRVFEQAPAWGRLGAGIILGANVGKVMRALDLEARFNATGFRPGAYVSRQWDTGEAIYEFTYDAERERAFGGAFVNIHRADLHALLESALLPQSIAFDHRLVGIEQGPDGVRTVFANGQSHVADIVIGADGLRSAVRDIILGKEEPRYIGKMAPRAVVSTERLNNLAIRDCTKWWGPDRHLVTYLMSPRGDELYVMGAVPKDDWDGNPSPVPGSRDEFAAAFADFHPDLNRIMDVIDDVTISPICDRPRNDHWFSGPVVLMGDACHPMRPFMAAGGSMAIEDAAVLSRCIQRFADAETAFSHYRAMRIPRVDVVQRISIENSWMRGPADTEWFYGYDATTTPIEPAGSTAMASEAL